MASPPRGAPPSSGSPRSVRSGSFRAHARRAVQLHARVTHIDVGWQRDADVVNLGLGGACLLIDEFLGTEDKVTLSFVAPTLWDPLLVRGRVVWVRAATPREPTRAGIAFEHRSAASVLALFELVNTTSYE